MNVVHLQERGAMRRAAQIECQVVRERDFKLVGKRTFNLSTEGMLVPTSLDVEPGDELIVSFQLGFGVYVHTDAVAARLVRGLRQHDQGPCVGVRFNGLDPIARHILRGSLRRVPPPLPRRARSDVRIDYVKTILSI